MSRADCTLKTSHLLENRPSTDGHRNEGFVIKQLAERPSHLLAFIGVSSIERFDLHEKPTGVDQGEDVKRILIQRRACCPQTDSQLLND